MTQEDKIATIVERFAFGVRLLAPAGEDAGETAAKVKLRPRRARFYW